MFLYKEQFSCFEHLSQFATAHLYEYLLGMLILNPEFGFVYSS